MAEAVKELWPDTKLAIGPSIADGFYYDFDKKEPFTDEDLAKIEKKMLEIIKRKELFKKEELSKPQAIELFKKINESYKLELLEEIPDETVSVYKTGDKFIDLCRGPHINSTADIKAFKLLSVAGAYWRGNEKKQMLQRIYGTAFATKEELDKYLYILEESKKRDHRKLGVQLEYFNIEDEMGAGLVFWYPKGALLRKIIEDFWKEEHIKRGYLLVNTPHIGKIDLWKTSGHLDFYQDYMYSPMKVEEQEYILKPMNCPGHILIYKSKMRSYNSLPLKLAELGTVYRYERSGVLHGLLRVRGFTQDDAHIFCTAGQLQEEIQKVLDLTAYILAKFGFKDYDIYVSTMPVKHVGEPSDWELATRALKDALDNKNIKWSEDPGEGVFYGPKIDLKIKDALGRAWQCTTIQVDFNLPSRFKISYIDHTGKEATPIMVHRAIFGSLERFLGVLLEHYAGALPLWLSPAQAIIIPIKDTCKEYAKAVSEKLLAAGFRPHVDERNETLQKRIREAEMQKVPYILVIGEREISQGAVAVRKRGEGDQGAVKLEEFINRLGEEVKN